MKHGSLVTFSLVVLCSLGCQKIREKHPLDSRLTCRGLGRDAVCQKGIDAYSNTVFPFIRKSCLPCHDAEGMANRPFAVSDLQISYDSVLRYQDFNAVASSYFVTKFNPSTMNPNVTQTDIEIRVKQWWDSGQKDCTNIGKFVTNPNPVPQTAAPSAIRFGLSDLVAGLGNASFEVSVRREGDSYTVEKPRLVTRDSPIHIAGVNILLNGSQKASANGWNSIKASIPSDERSGALLAACTLRVPVENGDKDEISFSFDSLEKRAPFSCKKLSVFQKDVLPVLRERSCYRCHSGGPEHAPGEEQAKKALDMELADEALCLKLLSRGNGTNSVDSPLIALPLRGIFGHPRAIALSSEVLPAWSDWIDGEGVH